MHLLVGLGNPGASYAQNRHNVGFMAADEIVRRHSFSGWRSKFQGLLCEGTVDGHRLLLLKPQTFMNLSGQAVAEAARFHKIPLEQIVVVHDELDLPPGKLRVKKGGGAGGHNGLKSIDAHLGADYWRVRVGIGHPGAKELVSPWVLSNFSKGDGQWLEPLLEALAKNASLLLENRQADFMNRLALAVPAAKSPKPDPKGGPDGL